MPAPTVAIPVVLASQSPYRCSALEQLGIRFETDAPRIDETPRQGENISDLVKRLSMEKVQRVAGRHPRALVIGGDQCASLQGRILGKPHSFENAAAQLGACSGRTVTFHSGVCVLHPDGPRLLYEDSLTRVAFRSLSGEEIASYVKLDEPYDCAGSIRCERLGSALLERVENQDPTTLMGLPLITLCRMLRRVGVDLLAPGAAGEL